jgi:hypothetical protein
MSHNPYATPLSDVSGAEDKPVRLYSPVQAAFGVFLGGPAALVYFLRENFVSLGNERLAKNTLIYGAALFLALVVVLPFLPDNFPNLPFTIVFVFTAHYFVGSYQVTKQGIIESPKYEFHSNWRVFGFGLLCLIVSALLIVGPMAGLVALGIIE